MQLHVQDKLRLKDVAESFIDDLEDQSYVFSDVDGTTDRPMEGSRVRFVLDKSRPGSFRALVLS
jgi:hypothetical protein